MEVNLSKTQRIRSNNRVQGKHPIAQNSPKTYREGARLDIKESEPTIALSEDLRNKYRYFYRPYKQTTQKSIKNSLYFDTDTHGWIDIANLIIDSNNSNGDFLNIIEFYRENHNEGYKDKHNFTVGKFNKFKKKRKPNKEPLELIKKIENQRESNPSFIDSPALSPLVQRKPNPMLTITKEDRAKIQEFYDQINAQKCTKDFETTALAQLLKKYRKRKNRNYSHSINQTNLAKISHKLNENKIGHPKDLNPTKFEKLKIGTRSQSEITSKETSLKRTGSKIKIQKMPSISNGLMTRNIKSIGDASTKSAIQNPSKNRAIRKNERSNRDRVSKNESDTNFNIAQDSTDKIGLSNKTKGLDFSQTYLKKFRANIPVKVFNASNTQKDYGRNIDRSTEILPNIEQYKLTSKEEKDELANSQLDSSDIEVSNIDLFRMTRPLRIRKSKTVNKLHNESQASKSTSKLGGITKQIKTYKGPGIARSKTKNNFRRVRMHKASLTSRAEHLI
ncbi:unnamed protein product [Moneuplotes crassus]|uniref:Uncharacterized protein n=1 Tax=Euplotes crassus TaxID=5936 RepID=A0AAD1U577_EUPCR|nr:unnamed protein product [Moneuplotes crassus]